MSIDLLLKYHIIQMELHRYLLCIDQETVGAKFVSHPRTHQKLPVPVHPELGACVICDIRGASVGSFYDASSAIAKMIQVDKQYYYYTMDRMLIGEKKSGDGAGWGGGWST